MGVISFIFADLITLPLLLIYRRDYGWRLTLRIVAVFWTVMSAAGLAVEYTFGGFHAVPAPADPDRGGRGGLNAITILDVIALAVFAGLWRLTHTRERSGGGAGYAIDPVCGMQVETTTAPARVVHDGAAVHFCSDRCGLRFETDLQRSSTATVGAAARMGT